MRLAAGPCWGGAIALPRLPSRYKGKGGNGQERERKEGKEGRDVNGLRVMRRGKADWDFSSIIGRTEITAKHYRIKP